MICGIGDELSSVTFYLMIGGGRKIDSFSLQASWIIYATDFTKEPIKTLFWCTSAKVHYSGQKALLS